ncbi:hypothetical protein [Moorena bouillonii]|nr:hypothetical protein [Moorena bouillonii]
MPFSERDATGLAVGHATRSHSQIFTLLPIPDSRLSLGLGGHCRFD